ncbi:MAG TPA: tetratricopeptide repeat protein, partial [Bacteroidota bacterium]|nr:tetratricopeptide repeat protein [Bacteroidota bacterium]
MKTDSNIIVFIAACCMVFSVSAQGAIDSTGIKLLESWKTKQAQEFFESEIRKNPRDAEAHYYLAGALQRQGKSDEAEDAIDEALEINENVSKYHYLRGAILGDRALKTNRLKQAILAPRIKRAFLRSVELDPSNIDGHIGLFNYYMQAPGIMGGSEEKGFEEANKVLSLNPYRGHQMLAGYYARVRKDATKAEEEFRKMTEADPKNRDGYFRYGMFLVHEKKTDQAMTEFNKMLAIDPRSAETNFLYGRALFSMDQWDKA